MNFFNDEVNRVPLILKKNIIQRFQKFENYLINMHRIAWKNLKIIKKISELRNIYYYYKLPEIHLTIIIKL